MKFEIKSWINGSVLFSAETESLKLCVELAVKSGASLEHASLDHARLEHASLDYARLEHASLDGAVYSCAQVAFTGHGECGRMLTAVQIKDGDPVLFFCGCFTGDESELREYIAAREQKYRKTRKLALDTALILLAANNEDTK